MAEGLGTSYGAGAAGPLYSAWLGWSHCSAREYEEALAGARKAPELNPNFQWGLSILGAACAGKGAFQEATATHRGRLRALLL